MAKQKKSPVDQKAKLVDQLKEIEKKIADFDKQRASKVGSLAKRYRLIDLSDDILEKEFKGLRDKYKNDQDATLSNMDDTKKKS
ncbi:MAG: hypothetical protein COV52_09660 [Gammaproteobacteria bacterium CG11_big_fil_rev_8_21_14_0_20_46_22]|nr:MAG: hypothetical protein COV52_09660 [Gammaproteobacteria bacterium CG11_big_fil_rev_8_21_14_0_20_46_22]